MLCVIWFVSYHPSTWVLSFGSNKYFSLSFCFFYPAPLIRSLLQVVFILFCSLIEHLHFQMIDHLANYMLCLLQSWKTNCIFKDIDAFYLLDGPYWLAAWFSWVNNVACFAFLQLLRTFFSRWCMVMGLFTTVLNFRCIVPFKDSVISVWFGSWFDIVL